MEIKTTMATCPNGHHFDSARHSKCPVCGAPSVSGQASLGSFTTTEKPNGGFNPTERPNGSGSFIPTEDPHGGGSGGSNITEPPDDNNSQRRNSSWGEGTIIGGDRADGDLGDPVVGWLVCIEGPARGTDYRIHAGYNYIGRETGDIRIEGDRMISRHNHAMIAFDSGDVIYFVGPAAGRNIIKVNGKTVLNAVEIKTYDVISIGSTKLMFVALCSEKFNWDKRIPGNG